MAKKRTTKKKSQGKRPQLSVADALKQVIANALDPKTFCQEFRRECVAYLFTDGVPILQIASTLHCARKTVYKDLQIVKAEWAAEFKKLDPYEMGAGLWRQAEVLARKAQNLGAPKDAWAILDGCVNRLQSMGMIGTAPQRQEINLTLGALIEAAKNGQGGKTG